MLRSLTDVAMVQAADLGKLHEPSCHGKLDLPSVGCVLVEREVRPRLMVIGEIGREETAEMSLAEHEQ